MKFRYLILLVFFLQSSNIFFGQTGYFTLRGQITDSSEPRLVFTNCKIYIYSDSNLVAIAKTDFDGKYQCDQLKPNLSKSLKIKLKYIKGEGVSKEIFVPESQLSATKKRIQPDKYVEFNYDFCDSLITKNNFLENESIPKLKYFSNAKIILVYSPFDTLLNSITEVRIFENSRLLTTIERTDKNVFNIKLPKKINLKNLSVELEFKDLMTMYYFKITKRKFKKIYTIELSLLHLRGWNSTVDPYRIYDIKRPIYYNLKEKIILKAPESNTPADMESKPLDPNLQNR